MPDPGVLTKRAPDERECADIKLGLEVAQASLQNEYWADGCCERGNGTRGRGF